MRTERESELGEPLTIDRSPGSDAAAARATTLSLAVSVSARGRIDVEGQGGKRGADCASANARGETAAASIWGRCWIPRAASPARKCELVVEHY